MLYNFNYQFLNLNKMGDEVSVVEGSLIKTSKKLHLGEITS